MALVTIFTPVPVTNADVTSHRAAYGESVVQTTDDVVALITERARVHGIEQETLIKISFCESSHRPDAVNNNKREDGSVWSSDVGPMQINDHYHKDRAEKMGLDIHDPHDNIVYGVAMASTQGTKPWDWSKKCWSKK